MRQGLYADNPDTGFVFDFRERYVPIRQIISRIGSENGNFVAELFQTLRKFGH